MEILLRGARGEETELVPLMPEESAYEGWPEFAGARNIAHMYSRLFENICNNTRSAPTFQDALLLHELIDDIEQSAQSLR